MWLFLVVYIVYSLPSVLGGFGYIHHKIHVMATRTPIVRFLESHNEEPYYRYANMRDYELAMTKLIDRDQEELRREDQEQNEMNDLYVKRVSTQHAHLVEGHPLQVELPSRSQM
eukprot:GHVP01031635.1.p2 GENE.GHVP01031635.1~~GHVP01031635.1.p2  ORF type:complete len:114 (+),score=14.65 GHVP01031635.1:785-1126(+)